MDDELLGVERYCFWCYAVLEGRGVISRSGSARVDVERFHVFSALYSYQTKRLCNEPWSDVGDYVDSLLTVPPFSPRSSQQLPPYPLQMVLAQRPPYHL